LLIVNGDRATLYSNFYRKNRYGSNIKPRRDGEEFMALASRVPIHTTIQTFPLAEANQALTCLRTGKLQGAAVLMMS
jgi:D-arabinose 1-dehydrogenase-like Zn-dependent alcohol dehydrogenase